MDAHREVSLSRTYAPNDYTVWLSPQDRARYAGVEQEVIDELAGYLLEHARQEAFVLATPPKISIETDEQLALGEFGIAARLTRPAGRQAGAREGAAAADPREEPRARPSASEPSPAPASAGSGQTMIWSGSERVRGPLKQARELRANAVLVRSDGRREPLPARGVTIGRSRECEIVVEDPGVSRQHAAIRHGPDGWLVEDLGSTNGSSVNGAPLERAHVLANGDVLEVGSTKLRFEAR